MTTTKQDSLTPARDYARAMLRMRELAAEGKDEGAEAEAIQDGMDAPWRAMTAAERRRMDGLSEDLYSLQEGLKPAAMSPPEARQWAQQLRDAISASDCDRALGLLHHAPEQLPPQTIALLRGRCWDRLGDPEVGQVFLAEAERLALADAAARLALSSA